MCDPRDIGVTFESVANANTRPTITIYDTIPMGLGFADQLFDLHTELLNAARSMVADCACEHGCPACVGPPPEDGLDLRGETRLLLDVILG